MEINTPYIASFEGEFVAWMRNFIMVRYEYRGAGMAIFVNVSDDIGNK